MTVPPKRPSTKKKPVRRRPRRRGGFRRFVAVLVAALAMELAWRAGAFAHSGGHLAATPISHDRLPPLAGPPVASRAQTESTMQRLISLGRPVSCGGGTKPLVALTFDDGPGPYTQQAADILQRARARATVFIVAKQLDGWPPPADEPRPEATVGSTADRTYDHA